MALGDARGNCRRDPVDGGVHRLANLSSFLWHLQRGLWLSGSRHGLAPLVLPQRSRAAFRGCAECRSRNSCFSRTRGGKKHIYVQSCLVNLLSHTRMQAIARNWVRCHEYFLRNRIVWNLAVLLVIAIPVWGQSGSPDADQESLLRHFATKGLVAKPPYSPITPGQRVRWVMKSTLGPE